MRTLALAVALVAAIPSLAQAQPASPQESPWTFVIGAAASYRPEYEGGKIYEASALPSLDVRYRDIAFASLREGIGVNLLRTAAFRAGVLVKYRFGREEDASDALRGMGDIDGTIEAGAFGRFTGRALRGSVEVRKGVNGHEGWVADLGLDVRGRISDVMTFSVGPRVSWTDDTFAQTYFGVSAAQAARSGYRRYEAEGGIKSVGLAGSLGYQVTPAIGAGAFAQIGRLTGDAADSPIVKDRGNPTQASIGLSLTYRFSF